MRKERQFPHFWHFQLNVCDTICLGDPASSTSTSAASPATPSSARAKATSASQRRRPSPTTRTTTSSAPPASSSCHPSTRSTTSAEKSVAGRSGRNRGNGFSSGFWTSVSGRGCRVAIRNVLTRWGWASAGRRCCTCAESRRMTSSSCRNGANLRWDFFWETFNIV